MVWKTSSEWQFGRRKCLVDERGQRRMVRLVCSERKAMVTQLTWTWQWVQFSSVAFPVTGSESNRTPLGCGRMAADKSAEIVGCNHVNMEKNLKGIFSTSCGIHATNNWGSTQYFYSVTNKMFSERILLFGIQFNVTLRCSCVCNLPWFLFFFCVRSFPFFFSSCT